MVKFDFDYDKLSKIYVAVSYYIDRYGESMKKDDMSELQQYLEIQAQIKKELNK